MTNNEIYRILYVENNPEKITQLKQLIRTHSVDSKITFDVTTSDSIDGVRTIIDKNSCDLIILQDTPEVPNLKSIDDVIGVKHIPVLVLVNADQFLEKRAEMIEEGAIDVGTLLQGDVLFKQIVRAIFELKTQSGYRDILEKNAKLTEITAQLAESSEDMIAYFGAEDGLFLYANESFLHYFGFKDFDELAATTVLEYVDAEQIAQFKKMMKIVGKTGKEQIETLDLKSPSGEIHAETVALKQAMYEESACLEILIGKSSGSVSSVSNGEVLAPSKQTLFYDRLTFIDSLPNYVGSSSWLVCLVLQDYFNFRKKYGVETLELYFYHLAKHLYAQISNLHYVRYSDESIVLLLTNSDMTKVDRLGLAIVASADGFVYQTDEVIIQGKFSFAYNNLGDSKSSIAESLLRLDEASGLLNTRVIFTDDDQVAKEHNQSTSDEEIIVDSGDVDEEFLPLYDALRSNLVKQIYLPIVDFSMKGQENYIASFELLDEGGDAVIWNKTFTYTADIPLMKELDQLMMTLAINSIKEANDPVKRIIVPLSKYYLKRPGELLAWIKQFGHQYFIDRQIFIGLADGVVDDNFDDAQQFFKEVAKAGYAGIVYDVTDILITRVAELNVVLVALSENCINRMSREMTSEEMLSFPKLIKALSAKKAVILATGVNSPTSMTLVWEYNIPNACGQMIGMPRDSIDFDFSQVIM